MNLTNNIQKNIIFLYAFSSILLLSLIYYLSYDDYSLQVQLHLLTQTKFDTFFKYGTYFYLFLTIFIILISQYLHSNYIQTKNSEIKSRKELEIINSFYNKFQQFRQVRDISDNALKFLETQLDAQKGKLYIVDYLNEQLYLASTLNTIANDEEKTLEIYRGTVGETVAFKKIKYIKKDVKTIVFIPLISDKKTIAVIILEIDDTYQDVVLSEFHHTLINLIADFLQNAIKNEQMKKYYNLIDNYVLMSSTNLAGNITYISKAFENTLGYDKDEILGKNHNIIRSKKENNEVFQDMWNTIKNGEIWSKEIRNSKKDDSTCWLDTTIQPEFDYFNNIIGYTAIRVDITDKKTVEKLSITDSMTKLFNRGYFDSEFPKQLQLSQRLNKSLAFCMLDIDHFKQYNDTYGHQEGDNALIQVANTLKKSLCREGDLLFRLGGEEFGMLYFVKNEKDAFNIANNTRQNIEHMKIEHKKNSASKYVTVSMGLFFYNTSNNILNPEKIYQETDKLLYRSKQNGRNKITI